MCPVTVAYTPNSVTPEAPKLSEVWSAAVDTNEVISA